MVIVKAKLELNNMQELQKSLQRWIAITAATFGFSSVAFGAFGAHLLKATIAPERLSTWQTAVDYQMFHTTVLLTIFILYQFNKSKLLVRSALSITFGVVLFSGSLYLLVLTDTSWLGIITPIGGILLLIGWFVLLLHFLKTSRNHKSDNH